MAYAGSDFALPTIATPKNIFSAPVSSIEELLIGPLRRRWIYHRTLAQLDGYSDRALADIGATQGIEEFARRAARL